MEKGITLFFYFVLLPLSGWLVLTWIVTLCKFKRYSTFLFLLDFWGVLIFGTCSLWISQSYFKPIVLTQKDIYGTYVIDRDQFPGKQADWQYDNFRFTITPELKMIFESRLYEGIWRKEIVDDSFSTGYFDLNKKQYCNKRIRLHSDLTNHHIIRDNPTLYRKKFNAFYYVFNSEKFGNVFFKKGQWENKR